MNKIIYGIVALLFICFNLSCNNESAISLGGKYFFIPFQEAVFDQTTFSGNGIYLVDTSRIPVIFPKIIKYAFDSNYITAEQRFDFKETKVLLTNLIYPIVQGFPFSYRKGIVPINESLVDNAPDLQENVTMEEHYVDSIMKMDPYIRAMKEGRINYYIIDKANHELMGPYTKLEFDKKCSLLHLPKNLKVN